MLFQISWGGEENEVREKRGEKKPWGKGYLCPLTDHLNISKVWQNEFVKWISMDPIFEMRY